MNDSSKTHGKLRIIIAAIVFALLAALYFAPTSIPHKICFPAAWLACCCLVQKQTLPTMAFLLSATGDFAGSLHLFLPQLVFFALAHVAFTISFIRIAYSRPKPGIAGIIVAIIFAMAVFIVAVTKIVNHAPAGIMQAATMLYAMIILTMFLCALFTHNKPIAIGAMLFVVSDFVLAWNKFTSHIDNAGVWIMTTYYCAQLLLALGILSAHAKKRIDSSI